MCLLMEAMFLPSCLASKTNQTVTLADTVTFEPAYCIYVQSCLSVFKAVFAP